MTNFINMKIPVEGNLEEIVAELERLGYRKKWYSGHKNGFICGCDDGGIMDLKEEPCLDIYKPTTLSELKAMK